MKRLFAVSALLLGGCATVQQDLPSHRFDNAAWYDSGAFVKRTAYVIDGRLHFGKPGQPASTVHDLAGGYAVPPYCEGHNHNFGASSSIEELEEVSDAYLAAGVFYAFMAGSFELYRNQIREKINRPDSIDVAFANNGLTGPGGHPRALRESLIKRFGLYPEYTPETLADVGYFEAADREQMLEKWALIRAEKTDALKVMLFFSEEYEKRREDPEFYGKRGLDPALLPELVTLAHAVGIPVAVHVESEVDMVTAIRAGADIIAHLPSYDAPIHLSDDTVALAAASGVALVTTFSLSQRFQERDPKLYESILNAQRNNLRRLHKAGAWLVVGSDNTRDTSRLEMSHLHTLGSLDNAALLDMWTRNCARMVFPNRLIGQLREGYEASFLILDGNPLEAFSATEKIRLRVKNGNLLHTGE